MKVSVIGTGNVGGMLALWLVLENISDIVLLDAIKNLAEAKTLDLEDLCALLKIEPRIRGTDNFEEIRDSDIVIITAGFTRRPGMKREDLLLKNAQIIKDISLKIKTFSPQAIVIVITNPLDLMTQLVFKITGFSRNRVIGMGLSLDCARFTNLIAKELDLVTEEIQPVIIGSHGEGMLPLLRLTKIKGISFEEFLDEEKSQFLISATKERGARIVSLLGTGSAYFAPSLASFMLVRSIIKDEKRIIPVCVNLQGEYGIEDVSLGTNCCIGKEGIERIIELELNKKEKEDLLRVAQSLKEEFKKIDSLILNV